MVRISRFIFGVFTLSCFVGFVSAAVAFIPDLAVSVFFAATFNGLSGSFAVVFVALRRIWAVDRFPTFVAFSVLSAIVAVPFPDTISMVSSPNVRSRGGILF